MTDRVPRRAGEGGFTLLEIVVALGILVFGATALIGALSVGVNTRRGTEMRARAALMAGQVLQHVERELLASHPIPDGWETAEDLAIPREEVAPVDGYPGMKYSVEFTTTPERPDVVLVTLRISWRDQGEDQAQVLQRVMPRAVPLSRRVENRRKTR